MAVTSSGASDLHVQPHSLLMPALLDLFVHSAPDWVLGDGGSLYLTLDPPEGHRPAGCAGCTATCRRAYLVATTRDHQRARLGEQFYCASRERYHRAGDQIEEYLDGALEAVRTELRTRAMMALSSVSADAPPDLPARALRLFRTLFCSTQPHGPSLVSQAIATALNHRTPEAEATAPDFEATANAFAREQLQPAEAGRRPRSSPAGATAAADDQDVNRSGPRWRACQTLLRHAAAMLSDEDRESAINGIVWELFQVHPLLKERLEGYECRLRSVRTEFPELGLSGWSCAFGVPVRLRSIENPFEIRAFVERERQKQQRGSRRLPMPIWGDHTRGHQDRLEREGRPFLVVPLYGFAGARRTRRTLGFLRVATKREGERRFTPDNQLELQAYADLLSRFVSFHLPDSARRGALDAAEWTSLFLYGAIKGQSIKDLGKTVAECFREAFGAAAASVFLRRDLWLADEARPADPKKRTAAVSGQRYVLWGTDAGAGVRNRLAGEVGHLAYVEGEGKTGWVLRHKAAVQAQYKGADEVIVRLSRHQVVRGSAGAWNYDPPSGIPAVSPFDVDDLMEKFRIKESAKGNKRELKHEQHAGVVLAPLIDPDRSPEPLGVIRLIFTEWKEPADDPLIVTVARLARSLSQQMRAPLDSIRLLRTFPRLVAQATKRYKPGKRAAGADRTAMMAYGPYGEVAASLLELGEASAVSVFVNDAFAPAPFRQNAPSEPSWVLVGAAASADALTDSDRHHFCKEYCENYLVDHPGDCRYQSGHGRTGQAIQARRRMYVEPEREGEHEKSEFVCEVTSPVAMLVIPTSSPGGDDGRDAGDEPGGQVEVVVRLVRTGERRRAAFLDEEQERLETVVGALRSLVPAWSEQNELGEFFRRRTHEALRVFPKALLVMILDEVNAAALAFEAASAAPRPPRPEEGGRRPTPRQARDELLKRWATTVPRWVISDARPAAAEQRGETDVRREEIALLAWFLDSLLAARRRTRLVDLVEITLRGLLRVHWGPAMAAPWEEKLHALQVFEPVLSQLPRYRDHSVHQLQVFLIGWLMLRRLGLPVPREDEGVADPDVWKTWVLASVFHDIAYPLERVEQWANLFAGVATDDFSHRYVIRGAPADSLEVGTAGGPLERYLGELAGAIAAATEPPPAVDRAEWERCVLEDLVDRAKSWDHGLWAALVLLRDVDGSPPILTAAAAIALHAGMLWKVAERRGAMTDRAALLPVLLALADGLHEWGRDVWRQDVERASRRDGGAEEDHLAFDEVALRPRLARMTFRDSPRRAQVDIALAQRNGRAVDAKLRELQRLKGVLRLLDFSLQIRVSQGSPAVLAGPAAAQCTVTYEAGEPPPSRPGDGGPIA